MQDQKTRPCEDQDENTAAKSLIDEIIEETETEREEEEPVRSLDDSDSH